MKRLIFLAVWFALFPPLLFAAPQPTMTPAVNYPLITGAEVIGGPVAHPPYLPVNNRDVIGTTEVIGTTWYENQHSGTIGRMLEKDEFGYIHFTWMNGLDYGAANRHIYYNYLDPSGVQGSPGVGFLVESSERAGYTTLDVDHGGIAFPCFHWTDVPGGDFWTAVAVDVYPHFGTFIVFEAPTNIQSPILPEILWPKMQFDRNGRMHIISTENPAG
jgi:hypothetical protein